MWTRWSSFQTARTGPAVLAITLLVTAGVLATEVTWPRWRGARGDGHTTESGLPQQWDASSVIWKTPLKGSGHSSPVVWGDRIFLTTALGSGKQRLVFCVNASDGQVLWEQVAWTGEPEKSHVLNGWATCYDAKTGREWWKERLDGQFSSSPIAMGGLALHQNEAGQTVVIDPGPALRIVARNSLEPAAGELFRASLTPAGGRIYSRSDKCLYCIGNRQP